ncbi:MAG: hypothetical protein IJM50_01035 [Lachnospiraceae bacterium]|nr:hypothetical protein [Lachnospiraceae bacterium]
MKKAEENANVVILGIGGAGVQIAGRLLTDSTDKVRVFGLDSCKEEVCYYIGPDSENGIVIGWGINHGLGAGADVQKGRAAAEADKEKIETLLQDADAVVLVSGFGGGIGTGATLYAAEMCARMHIPTAGVIIMPLSIEGPARTARALKGLSELEEYTAEIALIKLDELAMIYHESPSRIVKTADRIACEKIREYEAKIRSRWQRIRTEEKIRKMLAEFEETDQ